MEGPHGIAHDLNWTNTNKGSVDSALFYGYISTQIPGGCTRLLFFFDKIILKKSATEP